MRHLHLLLAGSALVLLSLAGTVEAQDIEPRRWTPLPVGMNVLGVGVVHSDGDIALDPVYALQTHLTYASPRHWWVSVGAGHDRGGESRINGVKKDDQRRDLLYGISAGLSIGSMSSVKLAYVGSRTKEDVGTDSDSVAFAYIIRF